MHEVGKNSWKEQEVGQYPYLGTGKVSLQLQVLAEVGELKRTWKFVSEV